MRTRLTNRELLDAIESHRARLASAEREISTGILATWRDMNQRIADQLRSELAELVTEYRARREAQTAKQSYANQIVSTK